MRKRWPRAVYRCFGLALAAALTAVNYSAPVREVKRLPQVMRVEDGRVSAPAAIESWLFGRSEAQTVSFSGDERLFGQPDGCYTFRLFGVIPLKTVAFSPAEACLLTPGGSAVGISIHTEGVLVVGLGTVETDEGPKSPAAAAGLEAGDVILSLDGTRLMGAQQLSSLCRDGEKGHALDVLRDGRTRRVQVVPVKAADGRHRLGVWARDSTAGVGTLSFCDVTHGWFAALGHAVSDIDTHSVLQVRDGRIVDAQIVDIVPGAQGQPGELMGVFSSAGERLGTIRKNTEYGIFGTMDAPYTQALSAAVPLGYAYEAHLGEATMLSTVSDTGTEAFDCEVIRVSDQDAPATKGMVIAITDEALLSQTGGIVQGMSGSPVLQDGKLIGVVTHVFVNDPTKGYCVYAEWMHKLIEEESAG